MKTNILSATYIFIFILLVCVASGSAAEREERVFKVSGPSTLSITSVSGSITVEAWAKNEILVIGEKLSQGAHLKAEQLSDRVRVRTTVEQINYQINTPADTHLDLRSTSGNIRVSGVSGKIDARTVSGSLSLDNLKGDVVARSVSGNLTIHGSQGNSIAISSVSGEIVLEGVNGRAEGKSVSGNLRVSKAACKGMDLVTTSGDISYNGRITKDGTYNLRTHSGNIQIVLPGDASFEAVANSFSGTFHSDFPLKTIEGSASQAHGRTSLRAVHGSGDAMLELKSFSGGIKITKQ